MTQHTRGRTALRSVLMYLVLLCTLLQVSSAIDFRSSVQQPQALMADDMNTRMESKDFKPVSPPTIELNDEEKRLFEKLRSMRMDLSRTENMPPYVIAHDSFLKRLAKAKPMTKEEMINIDGIGERNFEKYGVYFLKVIRSSSLGQENGK